MDDRELFLNTTTQLFRYPAEQADPLFDNAQKTFLALYPENCYQEYQSDPFRLVTQCGFPFRRMRYQRGKNDLSHSRIPVPTFEMHLKEVYACMYDCLSNNEREGHSWISTERVFRFMRRVFPAMTLSQLQAYCNYFSDIIYLEDDIMAFCQTKQKEDFVYRTVQHLLCAKENTCMDFQFDPDPSLDENQNAAIPYLMGRDLSILTGGPGTGKTTVIRRLLSEYQRNYPMRSVQLLAPTGKAAKRLAESILITGQSAHTVQYLTYREKFQCQIPKKKYDLLIIDEASMLDLETFYDLVRQVDFSKIILVGDPDQLPSVGVGNILADLIEMGVPTYCLKRNYRSDSAILENAEKINQNDPDLSYSDRFSFIEVSDEDLPERLTALDCTPDIILSPFQNPARPCNNQLINRVLQKANVPDSQAGYYYAKDRVIFLHNQVQKGYVNGDTGVVMAVDSECVVVKLDVPPPDNLGGVLHIRDLSDMDLAYAITIHKSQGSEYDTVAICIPKGMAHIFPKNILYTAVTRAKNKVLFLGSKSELTDLIVSGFRVERNTFLHRYVSDRNL